MTMRMSHLFCPVLEPTAFMCDLHPPAGNTGCPGRFSAPLLNCKSSGVMLTIGTALICNFMVVVILRLCYRLCAWASRKGVLYAARQFANVLKACAVLQHACAFSIFIQVQLGEACSFTPRRSKKVLLVCRCHLLSKLVSLRTM